MEFDEILKRRHSVRRFRQSDIPLEKLEQIIDAANRAPSAGNLQAYRIFAVSNQNMKGEIAVAANEQDFIAEASICLVFCADPIKSSMEYGTRGKELYSIQDATISATFALLKAVDLGYATAWIGAFNETQLRKILGIDRLVPVAIILIGEAAEEPYVTKRRSLRSSVEMIK